MLWSTLSFSGNWYKPTSSDLCTCSMTQRLCLRKTPFGDVRLTSAAFGVQSSAESADQYASYVLSGRFNADLGTALAAQPAILQNILRFRNTADGEAFRREVRDRLLAD